MPHTPGPERTPEEQRLLSEYTLKMWQLKNEAPTVTPVASGHPWLYGHTLIGLLRRRLRRRLPGGPLEYHKDGLVHVAEVAGFQIQTKIARGNCRWQIALYHHLRHPATGFRVEHLSLLNWLGIASDTIWHNITRANLDDSIELVRELIVHFLHASEEMAHDLAPVSADTTAAWPTGRSSAPILCNSRSKTQKLARTDLKTGNVGPSSSPARKHSSPKALR